MPLESQPTLLSARRARGVALALAALIMPLGAACVGAPSDEGSADPDSVLLITVDTLRADHLSTHGYAIPTSPALEGLAARGARFANAFSAAPITAPSHASIFTGQYPSFHTVGPTNGHFVLDAGTETLAETLRQRGLETAAIISNPVLTRELGLDQGFSSYDDNLEGVELNRDFRERYADVAVDKALEQLRRWGDAPFFLWLHLQDPHGPYTPPENWRRRIPDRGPGAGEVLPISEDNSGYRSIPAYQALDGITDSREYLHR